MFTVNSYRALATTQGIDLFLAALLPGELEMVLTIIKQKGESMAEHVGAWAARMGRWHVIELVPVAAPAGAADDGLSDLTDEVDQTDQTDADQADANSGSGIKDTWTAMPVFEPISHRVAVTL